MPGSQRDFDATRQPMRTTFHHPAPTPWTGRSALPVLVDFWAPWCGPCKMLAPELAKIAAEGAGRWLVAKVNTEELPGLAQRFRFSGIPTLALFKGGRETARQSGAMPAKMILQFIQQNTEPMRSV